MLRKLTIEKLAFVSNNSHVQSTTSQAQITTSGTWLCHEYATMNIFTSNQAAKYIMGGW